MRIFASAVLAFALLFSATLNAEASTFAATTANVAACNLAGFNAVPADIAPTFARAIADIDPEVLAVVEVNPDSFAGEIVAELNTIGICYERRRHSTADACTDRTVLAPIR